jgi:hypothetical protein
VLPRVRCDVAVERLDARLRGDSLKHISDRLGRYTIGGARGKERGGVFLASRDIM